MANKKDNDLRCAFCGRSAKEAPNSAFLQSGFSGMGICSDCLTLAYEQLYGGDDESEGAAKNKAGSKELQEFVKKLNVPNPAEMKAAHCRWQHIYRYRVLPVPPDLWHEAGQC